MTADDRSARFADLAAMPAFLERSFATLSAEDATWRAHSDVFAPVEQCWHLADLEREGVAVRIRRLLSETAPVLADFDGGQVAKERQYFRRSLADGLRAFQAARAATMEQLRAVTPGDWARTGTLEGMGAVALSDIPMMMAAHDADHRQQIEDWLRRRHERNATG